MMAQSRPFIPLFIGVIASQFRRSSGHPLRPKHAAETHARLLARTPAENGCPMLSREKLSSSGLHPSTEIQIFAPDRTLRKWSRFGLFAVNSKLLRPMHASSPHLSP